MGLVDTNVLVVANGRGGEANTCIDACVDCLAQFTENRDVLHLDSLGRILLEYGQNIRHGTPQDVGDQFFVWASTFQATRTHCRLIEITEDADWGFAEFPHDEALLGFDRSDRKFVAVAVASGDQPTIFNATDSDWGQFSFPLARYVQVQELCL